MQNKNIILLSLIGAGVFLFANSAFIVDQRETVVIRQFGQFVRSINETGTEQSGLQFKIPFIQELVRLDRRVLALDPPATEVLMGEDRQTPNKTEEIAIANDEADQRPRLVVDSFVRYRITNARDFVITVQNEDRLTTLLRPVVDDALRGVLGRYSLSQLLSEQRASIVSEIAKRVNEVSAASKYGVEIVDVRIRRADFPDRALQAVFDRMRSERDRVASQTLAEGEQRAQAIRAAADRERVEILAAAQRDSQKLRGEGDNQSIGIMAKVTEQDPQFYDFYRSMQAYKTVFKPENTTMVLSPDNGFLHYFGQTK